MPYSSKETLSHRLAEGASSDQDRGLRGDAAHLTDLGWNKDGSRDQREWVPGLHNEDVWLLQRRMNKVAFEIQRVHHVPDEELDLAVSSEMQCSPNKLRSEVERLYMGIGLGLLSFIKAVARLRSWHEPRRTGLLCFMYFSAWFLDHLFFVGLSLVMTLIVSTRARRLLFPPAPLSMINTQDGSAAKPMAGTLGSTDTVTGAPQNLRGESMENEASNFVTSFAAIAANLMTGQDPHGAPYDAVGGEAGGIIPHVNMGTMAVAKDKAEGMDRPSEDKTKTPMEKSIWAGTTPMLHQMVAASDFWERLANMLVPSPPFRRENHQIRLALYLTPFVLASLVISRNEAVRLTTLLLGVALFGKPLMNEAKDQETYRAWASHLSLSRTLFQGVPNDLQLAITLLRLGEASRAPLPPPVSTHEVPSDEGIELDETVLGGSLGDEPLGLSRDELQPIANHNEDMANEAGGADNEMKQAAGSNPKREKIFGILKDGARGAVKVVVAADKLRGKAGAPHSKLRAGVLPSSRDQVRKLGPVEFSARYDGKKGYVYVDSMADEPFVSFNRRSVDATGGEGEEKDELSLWSVKIEDIARLKRHSGYGMKTKLGTGWAVNGGVQDGLRIGDGDGNEWVVTAVPHRDALFNRLCAISKSAKWEIC
ncbi:hypothetical protein LIA77_06410 [Sarocladium implicatum]|nr:hypothetical protein LIA77_06410 [Sarocladium implicatum]